MHINLQRFVKRLTIYQDKAEYDTTSDGIESLLEKYNTVQFTFHENKYDSVDLIQNTGRSDFKNCITEFALYPETL